MASDYLNPDKPASNSWKAFPMETAELEEMIKETKGPRQEARSVRIQKPGDRTSDEPVRPETPVDEASTGAESSVEGHVSDQPTGPVSEGSHGH